MDTPLGVRAGASLPCCLSAGTRRESEVRAAGGAQTRMLRPVAGSSGNERDFVQEVRVRLEVSFPGSHSRGSAGLLIT